MKRRHPEQQMQIALIKHLRWHGAPGMVFWHTPNGGARGRVEAAIFKAMGVLPGVSDIIVVHEGQIYALELKASSKSLATKPQLDFLTRMGRAGARVSIADSLDRALWVLGHWGLLRGHVQ